MLKRGAVVIAVGVLFSLLSGAQESSSSKQDPFQLRIPSIELDNQSVVAGAASVAHSAALALSVEYPLSERISVSSPPLQKITATVASGTVAQLLDKLCQLDPTFAWIRDGKMVNLTLRVQLDDPAYVLNRRAHVVVFSGVRHADDAVMKLVDQLPGTREQLAVLQVGQPLDFAEPWSVTLNDVTVREVLNRIAQQFGPAYGWEFSGAQNFRMIRFHEALLPKPSTPQMINREP